MAKIRATVRPLHQIGVSENDYYDNASLATALREVARYLENDAYATVLAITLNVESNSGQNYLQVIYDCYDTDL